MQNPDHLWLCALMLASGKVSARDITPEDLEDFYGFIIEKPLDFLIAAEGALDFAARLLAELSDRRAVNAVHEINAMLEKVRGIIFSDENLHSAITNIMRQAGQAGYENQ